MKPFSSLLPILAAAAFALPPPLPAQTSTIPPPPTQGPAPQPGVLDTVGLRRLLDSARTELGITGLTAALVLPDGRVWTAGSGMADANRPATPTMLFEIGSVTKTYTAALVLDLVRGGALSLDDSVAHWVPELQADSGITVRHLLQHTSGLYDYSEDLEYVTALGSNFERVWAPEESMRYMKPAYFPPGRGWRYSNANYVALGLIVQRVTGRRYVTELRRRLLVPHRLARTFLDKREPVPGERAHGYIDINGDGTAEDLTRMVPNTSFITAAWAAAGIVATAEDVARWGHALYGGRVVTGALYDELTRWVERGDGRQYGLGVLREPVGGPTLLGHRGNGAGYSAALWHEPASGMTVSVLSNAHGLDLTTVARALLRAAR